MLSDTIEHILAASTNFLLGKNTSQFVMMDADNYAEMRLRKLAS